MTLAWYERSNAQWEAPVFSGSYFIAQDIKDGRRCFSVNYSSANYDDGASVTELATANTLGWARVIAVEHHLGLLAARPMRAIDPDVAADTAAAREFLRQARRPPCEQCLRPTSPCKERCLRSLLRGTDEIRCERSTRGA